MPVLVLQIHIIFNAPYLSLSFKYPHTLGQNKRNQYLDTF
jgi:hypothetical protein